MPQSPQSQSQQINSTADLEGDRAAPQVPRPETLDRVVEDEEVPSAADEMKQVDGGAGEEPTLAQTGDVRGISRGALDQESGQREQDPCAAVSMTDEPRKEGEAVCEEAGGVEEVGEVSGSEQGLVGEASARCLASETPHRKKQRRGDGNSADHGGGENKEVEGAPAASSPDHRAVPEPANAPPGTATAAPGPLPPEAEVGNDYRAAAVLIRGNGSAGEAEKMAVLGKDARPHGCGLSGGASASQPTHPPSDTDVAALEVGSTQAPAPPGGACAAQRRSVALGGFLGSLAAGDWDGAGLQELCNAQSQLAVAMQRLSGAIASRGMAAAAHQGL